MKRNVLSLLLAGAVLLGLSSCKMESTPEKYSELEAFPVVVENITLEEAPSAIVVLNREAADALSALELTDTIFGVAQDLSQDGQTSCGTAQDPDFDTILSLSPDLVITNYPFPYGEVNRFAEAGCKVLVLPSLEEKPETDYQEILSLLKGNPVTSEAET